MPYDNGVVFLMLLAQGTGIYYFWKDGYPRVGPSTGVFFLNTLVGI